MSRCLDPQTPPEKVVGGFLKTRASTCSGLICWVGFCGPNTHRVFGSLGHRHGSGKWLFLKHNYHNPEFSSSCLREGNLHSVTKNAGLFLLIFVGVLPTLVRFFFFVGMFFKDVHVPMVPGDGVDSQGITMLCCWSFRRI